MRFGHTPADDEMTSGVILLGSTLGVPAQHSRFRSVARELGRTPRSINIKEEPPKGQTRT